MSNNKLPVKILTYPEDELMGINDRVQLSNADKILQEIMDPRCCAQLPPNFPAQGPNSHTYCYYTYLDTILFKIV